MELAETPSGTDLDIMMEYGPRRRRMEGFSYLCVRIDAVSRDGVVVQPRFARIYRGDFGRT